MQKFMLAAALLIGFGAASPVSAAVQDGNWRVTIITEQGGCDRAYGYSVAINGGKVRYTGDADINMSGTVAPNGAVKVSVSKGSQRADGTGKLGSESGAGTWRGVAGGGTCAGRWEAEKRS